MIFILISTKKRKFGDHLTVHAPLLLRSCARLFVSCTTHTKHRIANIIKPPQP